MRLRPVRPRPTMPTVAMRPYLAQNAESSGSAVRLRRMSSLRRVLVSGIAVFVLAATVDVARAAQPPAAKPRARDLGVPFEGTPGPLNAITDVAGVAVGQTTLIRGDGKLVVGEGPVRTGVTAIVPRGKATNDDPVFAGVFDLNGAGELTGTHWIEESGFLEGPMMM